MGVTNVGTGTGGANSERMLTIENEHDCICIYCYILLSLRGHPTAARAHYSV